MSDTPGYSEEKAALVKRLHPSGSPPGNHSTNFSPATSAGRSPMSLAIRTNWIRRNSVVVGGCPAAARVSM